MNTIMNTTRVGIVGSGMIAGVIAKAIDAAEGAELVAIASRRPASAREFAREHGVGQVFDRWQDMVASDSVDAVYVATPTSVKEDIAVTAAETGKHILVDKPFASHASVQRMSAAAIKHSVLFMDATHFTHNVRTDTIKSRMAEQIGTPQALRSAFFFPFMDRTNIRFNTEKEPTGAVGDMAWYSMRAVVEYLQPTAAITAINGSVLRDPETGAIIRGAGFIAFEDGKTSTFDFGYNAGVCLMDLAILGTEGQISLDDFVLDWKHGFAFDNRDHVIGYTHRSGMQAPKDFAFVDADSEESQSTAMIRHFAKLCASPAGEQAKQASHRAVRTQELLDAFWNAVA